MLNAIKEIIKGKQHYMEAVEDLYEDVTVDNYVDDILLKEEAPVTEDAADLEEPVLDETPEEDAEDVENISDTKLDDESEDSNESEPAEPAMNDSAEVDIMNITLSDNPEDRIIPQDEKDIIASTEIDLQTGTSTDTVPVDLAAALDGSDPVTDLEEPVLDETPEEDAEDVENISDTKLDDESEDSNKDEEDDEPEDDPEVNSDELDESMNEFERTPAANENVIAEAITVDANEPASAEEDTTPEEKSEEESEEEPNDELNDVTAAVLDKLDEAKPEDGEDLNPEAAVEKESILDRLNRINADIKDVKQALSDK